MQAAVAAELAAARQETEIESPTVPSTSAAAVDQPSAERLAAPEQDVAEVSRDEARPIKTDGPDVAQEEFPAPLAELDLAVAGPASAQGPWGKLR